MPMLRTLNHGFFSEWSVEMAYVLGYFAADGSMVKNNRNAYYIEFTSTDRILIEHVQNATGSAHQVSLRERGGNCKTGYRIQIGSKHWFEDLALLGFTQNKSLTLEFPQVPSDILCGDTLMEIGARILRNTGRRIEIITDGFLQPVLAQEVSNFWKHSSINSESMESKVVALQQNKKAHTNLCLVGMIVLRYTVLCIILLLSRICICRGNARK